MCSYIGALIFTTPRQHLRQNAESTPLVYTGAQLSILEICLFSAANSLPALQVLKMLFWVPTFQNPQGWGRVWRPKKNNFSWLYKDYIGIKGSEN